MKSKFNIGDKVYVLRRQKFLKEVIEKIEDIHGEPYYNRDFLERDTFKRSKESLNDMMKHLIKNREAEHKDIDNYFDLLETEIKKVVSR